MAKIFIVDKENDKIVNTIICSQDFITFFDLDFGTFSFEDTYGFNNGTVKDLKKWIEEIVKTWRAERNVRFKWQTRPLEKAENEIIPFLKSIKKDNKVSIW